jgi:hypothetical protein
VTTPDRSPRRYRRMKAVVRYVTFGVALTYSILGIADMVLGHRFPSDSLERFVLTSLGMSLIGIGMLLNRD